MEVVGDGERHHAVEARLGSPGWGSCWTTQGSLVRALSKLCCCSLYLRTSPAFALIFRGKCLYTKAAMQRSAHASRESVSCCLSYHHVAQFSVQTSSADGTCLEVTQSLWCIRDVASGAHSDRGKLDSCPTKHVHRLAISR